MFIKQFFSLLFFCFITLSPASGAEDLNPAQQVIERSAEQIKQTLYQPTYLNDFNKATQFINGVVTKFVDMDKVAQLVLGKNLRKVTMVQRQQFKKEFKILVVRTYTRAFLDYKNWEITFDSNKEKPIDDRTLVKTVVHQSGQQDINISYRMLLNSKNEWKVYDIVIEGVSLVTTYRSSINDKIAKTGSIENVIQILAEKNRKVNLSKEH